LVAQRGRIDGGAAARVVADVGDEGLLHFGAEQMIFDLGQSCRRFAGFAEQDAPGIQDGHAQAGAAAELLRQIIDARAVGGGIGEQVSERRLSQQHLPAQRFVDALAQVAGQREPQGEVDGGQQDHQQRRQGQKPAPRK
jgi:hypothetical protein